MRRVTNPLKSVKREVLPDALRITLELGEEVTFRSDRLDAPPRVFIDFENTRPVEAIKDAYRDQRGLPFLETLSRDTRHAIRGLRRTPGFTATIVLTLALGVGANTAIFAVIDTILIKPLPYPQAEALVSIWHTAPGLPNAPDLSCSPSMYFTYREENRTLQHFGMWSSGGAASPALPSPSCCERCS